MMGVIRSVFASGDRRINERTADVRQTRKERLYFRSDFISSANRRSSSRLSREPDGSRC
jgi:hypothetical protein